MNQTTTGTSGEWTVTHRSIVQVWTDAQGFLHATADCETALEILRLEWYAKRDPAGYGEAKIRPTANGRFTMMQATTCD